MSEGKKNSLLVVDDENVNLKVLNHILGEEYTIYTAKNGINAIEKAKEYKPDLILLDIVMPEMDGYQALSIIKADEEIKKIPIIFITGLDSAKDE
jgi:CheY-like chemotaxis protein